MAGTTGVCCNASPDNGLSRDDRKLIEDAVGKPGLRWNLPSWLSSDSNDAGSDAKAPGMPSASDGFEPGKNGAEWVPNPNGKGYGWRDKGGRVWCPTGPRPGAAHGGPHWDVQFPNGDHTNVYPGGKVRGRPVK